MNCVVKKLNFLKKCYGYINTLLNVIYHSSCFEISITDQNQGNVYVNWTFRIENFVWHSEIYLIDSDIKFKQNCPITIFKGFQYITKKFIYLLIKKMKKRL